MPYQAELEKLAALETFDARAFEGTKEVPQNVCDFVLALALAYNDLRDLMFADALLVEHPPADPAKESRETGLYFGLQTTITRAEAAVANEIVCLIAKQKRAREDGFFRQVVAAMGKGAREAWREIEAAADNRPSGSLLTRALSAIRNKVAFHYDPKQLKTGLDLFRKSANPAPELFISRGTSMQRTRFYFADAAAVAFMRDKAAAADVELFMRSRSVFLSQVNMALHPLVTQFITRRGFAWRQFRPD